MPRAHDMTWKRWAQTQTESDHVTTRIGIENRRIDYTGGASVADWHWQRSKHAVMCFL